MNRSTTIGIAVIVIMLILALTFTSLALTPAPRHPLGAGYVTCNGQTYSLATNPLACGTSTTGDTSASRFGNSTETKQASSLSGSQAPSLSSIQIANVTLGGIPGHIAFNQNTSLVYVADLAANNVQVINTSSHSVVTNITLPGTDTFGMVVDSQANILYVPQEGCTNLANATNSCESSSYHPNSGSIVEIDAGTSKILGQIPINVERLTIDEKTDMLWALTFSGFLYEIGAQSGALIANVSLGGSPLSLAVNSATNMIYVADCGQMTLACGQAELFMVNGTTHSVKSTVSLSSYYDAINFNVVVDPSTNIVYVLGLGSRNMTLVSIEGTSGSILSSTDIGSSCAGAGGGEIAINSAAKAIYVLFAGQPFFLVLNASTGHISGMYSVTQEPDDLTYNPQTGQIYVSWFNGSFWILSGLHNTTFVDTSLLPGGICLP